MDELRKELGKADKRLPKFLKDAYKQIASGVADKSKPRVRALPSPGGSKAMSGIGSTSTTTRARVTLSASNPTIRANVFGTLSHKAWGHHVSGSGPWQPWLGTSWKPEDLYGIGPVIKEMADEDGLKMIADAWMEALSRAFPD